MHYYYYKTSKDISIALLLLRSDRFWTPILLAPLLLLHTDRFWTTPLFALPLLHSDGFGTTLLFSLLLQHPDRFWMTLLFGVPLSHSFFQSMVVVLPIKESYNLTDFERLFYLHYNYCYYYTDRFSTTLLFALLLQHWQIFNDSYCTISTTTATLKDFQRLLFALLLLQHSEIFNDSYLHYCYYYCNTQRFSTNLLFALLLQLLQHSEIFNGSFICTIAATTTATLRDFQRLLFALLLLLLKKHWKIFNDSYLHYCFYCTLTDFQRLLFALLLLHW